MTDYWDNKPDLTRLPEHLKNTLDKPIPLRTHEARAKVRVFKTPLNHPMGRLQLVAHQPDSEKPSHYDGLQVELLDYGGRPVAVAIVQLDEFTTVFKGIIRGYKRSGGDLDTLKQAIEEIEHGGNSGRADSEV